MGNERRCSRASAALFAVSRFVDVHGEQLKALRRPSRSDAIEVLSDLLATRRLRHPEIEQHRLSAKSATASALVRPGRKRKIRRGHRCEQPGFNGSREVSRFLAAAGARRLRNDAWNALCLEWFDPKSFGSLFHPDPVVGWKVGKILHEPAWPADRRSHGAFGLSQTEKYFLAVLRKKS